MNNIITKRQKTTHKGDYGRVAIISGSRGMTGAPYLTSQASLRTGAGLVYTIVPESIEMIMCIKLTEAIIKPVYDEGKGQFTRDSIKIVLEEVNNKDIIAIGPGLGVSNEIKEMIEELLLKFNKPIVIDADGINCIKNKDNLLKREAATIITPHPGELAGFLDISTDKIQDKRNYYAKKVSEKYNIFVVLKGNETIVASPTGDIYINKTGNPGMATAGSGDVLTGIISGLLSQGVGVFDACRLGVYIHGLAGDLAKYEKGEYGMIAGDILDNIPYAIKKLL